MVAIPSDSKKKAQMTEKPELLNTTVPGTLMGLASMRCKHYYKIINESNIIEPSGIKKWKTFCPIYFEQWKNKFSFIYESTRDNKLRQFSFKFLHTVPCKCKLTVSTRNSILEAIENRVSRFEARVSRRSKNFSRISMVDFEETINFSSLKQ